MQTFTGLVSHELVKYCFGSILFYNGSFIQSHSCSALKFISPLFSFHLLPVGGADMNPLDTRLCKVIYDNAITFTANNMNLDQNKITLNGSNF